MESLKQITEFKTSPELVEKLQQYSIKKEYEAGSVILNENAHIRSIPIVAKGTLKVIRTEEDDNEILLDYRTAGESSFMSYLGRLHSEASRVKVDVDEDAEIFVVPIDKVSLFIKEDPQSLDYIFRLYHKRFEDLLETVKAIAFKKI